MKRTVPLAIAAVTGFVLIVSYFIPYMQSWGEEAMIWFDILAAVAFVLGGGNLLKTHLQKISNRRAGWGFSIVTISAFLITLYIGFSKMGVNPAENFPEFSWSGDYLTESGGFGWIFHHIYLPLAATMFSLLAFYIASAAFRAFRAKNTEAMILLGTAFLVLFGRTHAGIYVSQPVVDWLTAISGAEAGSLAGLRLDRITSTITSIFIIAGNRAITIGIALGIVSLSLKVLLGVDRSYLGSEE